MREQDVEVMVVGPGPNMEYLSGVSVEKGERFAALLVPAEGEPRFVLPELHSDLDVGDVSYWKDDQNPVEVLAPYLTRLGGGDGRVLIDDTMEERHARIVRQNCEGEFGLVSEILREMRMVKTDEEVSNIREASEIADRVVRDVRELGDEAVGMTEKELAGIIRERMSEYGGEGESFPTIVAAGENGAKPHHEPTDREIKTGEPVVLDFGCWKNGYPSDQTRTLVFGDEPDESFKEVFAVVREAQQKAVEAVKPGMMTDEIDGVARSIIEDAGYGEQFVHRTGHGVGLEIHEHPKLPEVGEQIELKPGMVFSIEPGIYIDGEFGVRIEDLVLVTEKGCERLNTTSREYR